MLQVGLKQVEMLWLIRVRASSASDSKERLKRGKKCISMPASTRQLSDSYAYVRRQSLRGALNLVPRGDQMCSPSRHNSPLPIHRMDKASSDASSEAGMLFKHDSYAHEAPLANVTNEEQVGSWGSARTARRDGCG